MTKDDRDAIRILAIRAAELEEYGTDTGYEPLQYSAILKRAIRHLAYPDRDVYPKTRRATKGGPIVRR